MNPNKRTIAIAWLVSLGIAYSVALSAEDFDLLRDERIGELRIGLPASELKKAVPCKAKRGPDELWGADGAYHQEWKYADCGIVLGMVSDEKGAPKSIESITLTEPSDLRTARGIRIGSTEEQVRMAYQADWNREDSEASGSFVAGSLYGGLMLDFENGKASRIFLGAAAE